MKTTRVGRQWSGNRVKRRRNGAASARVAWRVDAVSVVRRAALRAAGERRTRRVAGNEWADGAQLATDRLVIETTHGAVVGCSSHYTRCAHLLSTTHCRASYSIINAASNSDVRSVGSASAVFVAVSCRIRQHSLLSRNKFPKCPNLV